jgi:hypothetical protein
MISRARTRLRVSGVLVGCLFVLLSVGAAAAPSNHLTTASGAKISAHLTSSIFTSSQAGSVKLIYKFSKPSKHFSYLLSFKQGSKWQTVKSVKKKGTFKGSKSMTVKTLFAGKPVRVGSYRLKLSVDKGRKLLGFRVVTAPSLSAGRSLSAGYSHTCDLLSGGTVKCWGRNNNGQLGNGTRTDSATPVRVSGITTATAIDADADHTCAVLSGGTVECWGTGGTTPVQVTGIAGATAISAGSYHTCALLSSGTIKCWGDNWNGQLGDGTKTNRTRPVRVSGITTAIAIRAGDGHTCALLSGGTVECWGANTDGQLGDGTTTK